jgi:hypothetical protein
VVGAGIAGLTATERHTLTEFEVQGLKVTRGATRVTLADGRSYTDATMGRHDLRDAIAILKATSLPLLWRASKAQLRS